MFEVDVKGLAELEGGKLPHRLAFEPIANVFDEFRGYGDAERRKPSFCAVTLMHSSNPRGVVLTVADDGAGFANERDIWTFFGTTAKRADVNVAGRFNAGDKQLLALARSAKVKTNKVTVEFARNERNVIRHREPATNGTQVEVLMPWSLDDLKNVRDQICSVIPPEGLIYTVDGATIGRPSTKTNVNVTLPTVALIDGVMKPTQRKSQVSVLAGNGEPMLCELGMPICSLAEVGFPWTLDVQQKVPVPISRDMVPASYLYRLIGSVLEHATMYGHLLLTEEQQGAGFIKEALEWIREPEALSATISSLFGENAVRRSSDTNANANAAAQGAAIISGRSFGAATRSRLDASGILPSAKSRFGEPDPEPQETSTRRTCPKCGGSGKVER
ncbi:MAG: hypothetical protein JNL18_18210 [Planctomycetaceae bacterium]|nr:hypothetical protein [Planctomycetaceae bacterium]